MLHQNGINVKKLQHFFLICPKIGVLRAKKFFLFKNHGDIYDLAGLSQYQSPSCPRKGKSPIGSSGAN